MKKSILFPVLFFVVFSVFGQGGDFYIERAVEKLRKGEMDKALSDLNKAIEFDSLSFVAYYYRGVIYSLKQIPEDALPNLDKALRLKPDFREGYLNRGIVRKCLTDYDGAISDYTEALKIDSTFAPAYYNRSMIYELFGEWKLAYEGFEKSLALGIKQAENKLENYDEDGKYKSSKAIYAILRLEKESDDKKYGFSKDNPIKVGSGPNGGPANQRAYLDLLRDKMGKPVKYHRVGSAGFYKSNNGLVGGSAVIDLYEIIYLNEKGKEKRVNVYISFYDYEEPMILKGFNTVDEKYIRYRNTK